MRVVISVGGTWHVPHLAFQLQAREMLQTVFTTMPKTRFLYRVKLDSKKIHWVPWPELFGDRLPGLLKFPPKIYAGSPYWHAVIFDKYVSSQLHSLRPDLLAAFSRFGLESFRICRSVGVATIVERHSTHTQYRERLLHEEYTLQGVENSWQPLDRRVVDRELQEYAIADYIGTSSRFVERSFVEMGVPKSKIVRIPMGVDVEWFHPEPQRKTHSFKVLCVGGLGIRKGTNYLVQGAALLFGLDLELVLVGSLDSFIAQKLQESRVKWKFVGQVPQHELRRVYNDASVYCLPSIEEAMSNTLLEAMACGLPVIASVNTGAADIITDGVDGFLVPIRDSQAIAEKLDLLYHNPELRIAMGEKARARALMLSWNSYGENIQRAYQRIVRERQ